MSFDPHQPALPLITPPPRRKRRRRTPDFVLEPRQTIYDNSAVDQAKAQCADSGNEVVSCFPTSNNSIPQHDLAIFVWNSRRPQLSQTNLVNIYLLRAGSDNPILTWKNVPNPTTGAAGNVGAIVNDSWFPNNGLSWNGSNISTPLYFVLTRNDETLDGSQTPQATFNAVQTTIADSVASSSIASVSAVSTASVASASIASVSSLSTASTRGATLTSFSNGTPVATGATGTPGNLQSGNNSSFPHWAIAVIVVLGFLAILAIGALIFLIVRRMRQREAMLAAQRSSMGSSSPMIPAGAAAAGTADARSPVMEEQRRLYDPPVSAVGHASLNSPNDDASMVSHAQSAANSTGDSGLFSGADAAIMADAFRKVLRKPDFAGRPPIEEGDSSPEAEAKPENRLMNWELAEEGRDIRSVGSSRGVRVETMSDDDADASTSRGGP